MGEKWWREKKKNCDPDVIRTRNLLIWSQTRYHCATESANSGNANNIFLMYTIRMTHNYKWWKVSSLHTSVYHPHSTVYCLHTSVYLSRQCIKMFTNIPEYSWTLVSMHTSHHFVKLYEAQLWHSWPVVTFTLTEVAGVTLVSFFWCIPYANWRTIKKKETRPRNRFCCRNISYWTKLTNT